MVSLPTHPALHLFFAFRPARDGVLLGAELRALTRALGVEVRDGTLDVSRSAITDSSATLDLEALFSALVGDTVVHTLAVEHHSAELSASSLRVLGHTLR